MRLEVASAVVGASGPGDDRAEIIRRGESLLVVVADGAGGTGSGSVAAEAIVRLVRQQAARAGELDCASLLAEADRQLAREGHGGQAAAVIASVIGSSVAGASVGDCGAWLVTDDAHLDLTRSQVRKPLIGTGAAIPIAFATQLAGTLLLATDGLLRYAPPPRICSAVRQPLLEAVPTSLVDLVRLRSGGLQDDVGVVVCRPVA